MNVRQKKFADNYIKTGNITQSAIGAGYSENYANAQGYKLLENVGVREYIEKVNKEIESSKIADMIEIKQFWTKFIRGDSYEDKDKLKASEYLARTSGAFIEKVEQTGDIGLTVRWTDNGDK